MVCILEGVCRTRQRMYQVSAIRDGGAKGIVVMLVWGSKGYVYWVVTYEQFSRVCASPGWVEVIQVTTARMHRCTRQGHCQI